MHRRLLAFTLLGLLVVGGLFAGVYAGAIQRALTPQMLPPTAAPNRTQPITGAPKAPTTLAPLAPTMAAAQPDLVAQDTFKRGDQPLWGTASDGRQWEADANTQQMFSIVGMRGQIAGGQGTLNAVLGPLSPNVNVAASTMINHFGNGTNIGIALRWTDADNWYKALLDGDHLTLLKRVQGQSTPIKSIAFNAPGGQAFTIRFQAIGAMLFVKAWRSDMPEPDWMIRTSDTVFTNGQVGMRVVMQPTTVVTFMSFKATVATLGNTI